MASGGYDDYFKKRKKVSEVVARRMTQKLAPPQRRFLRSSPVWLGVVASILAGGCGWYLSVGEERAGDLFSKLEFSIFGSAEAADGTAPSSSGAPGTGTAKNAETSSSDGAKVAADGAAESTSAKPNQKPWSEEEITLFKKLEARKKQLDAREAELVKLDEDLQQQKEDLEKRLTSLEDIRTKIATKLEDKVKVDAAKVDTLVAMYTNMKPSQAAKVIESINEDLAVEVLSKMKNKSAAEILNLMNAEVAKKLSERFAGFREPAQAAR